MTDIFRERIEMRIEGEVKELADIELSSAQFDKFLKFFDAQHTLPTRLKQASDLLDKEGF